MSSSTKETSFSKLKGRENYDTWRMAAKSYLVIKGLWGCTEKEPTATKSFDAEIEACQNNDELPTKSKLMSLKPFLDEHGILRVGGRLKYSSLPFGSKHPIILPKRHHFTKLIIEQAHKLTIHGGPTLMSAFLSNYYIFGRSEQIRRVVSKCVTCYPYNCKPQQQIMADLPKNRVTPNRIFSHSGVDFAGPYSTKSFIGRSRGKYANTDTKSYVAIFVCLSTKAVHIEFVSDLTSQAFIAAFKRFVSRKGRVSDLYSDCGSNFIGANRILQEHLKKVVDDPIVQNYFAREGTEWHFNPPGSPHHGGLWEAGVKSIKYHLKRLVGDNLFTFEEMTTILSQIEACLNSRPLCSISDSLNDMSYLTPGHFYLGEAPNTVPEPSLLDTKTNRLTRWQLVQKMYQQFWYYWSKDYLSKLQHRTKWEKPQENVKVGQLALYREDNLPPAKWPLAKIIEIHPGKDDNTREPVDEQSKVLRIPGGDKHVNIIFVKTPSSSSSSATEVILPEQNEQKNLVYVLLKKPEVGDNIRIRRPQPKNPTKPEVYFIRYKNQAAGAGAAGAASGNGGSASAGNAGGAIAAFGGNTGSFAGGSTGGISSSPSGGYGAP